MIALTFDNATGMADLRLTDGGDVETHPSFDIETALLVALFQDRRVEDSEVPAGVDLGGWWGDAYTEEPSDIEGSRLWTLPISSTRSSDELQAKATQHVREALAPFFGSGDVVDVDVNVEQTTPSVLSLSIAPVLSDGTRLRFTTGVSSGV